VFIEQERGEVHPVSWELLGAGRKLADKLGVDLAGVVLGAPGEGTRKAVKEAFQYGADVAYLVEDPILTDYRNEPYSKALTQLVNTHKPEILLLGATTLGRDLAGSVATTLLTGLTADCTELAVDTDGSLAATRPTFGGSLLCTIYTLNYRPQMATVRPRQMPMPARDETKEGRVVEFKADLDEDSIITKILKFIPDRESTKTNLAFADVVVAGGLGLQSAENFQLVRNLATTLGAEFGGSRPLVQKGWIGADRQIGQTGKTIRPKLYIAAGISGAIQHRVGVEGADMIVAINTDKNAPIFDFAHLGIVTDAIRLLPALTEAFRKRLSPHQRDRLAS
jgi:electron transfer flavoprotein alpha subunit